MSKSRIPSDGTDAIKEDSPAPYAKKAPPPVITNLAGLPAPSQDSVDESAEYLKKLFARPNFSSSKKLTTALRKEAEERGHTMTSSRLDEQGLARCHVLSFSNIRDMLVFAISFKNTEMIECLFDTLFSKNLGNGSVKQLEKLAKSARKQKDLLIALIKKKEPNSGWDFQTKGSRDSAIIERAHSLLKKLNSSPFNLSLGNSSTNSSIRNHLDIRFFIKPSKSDAEAPSGYISISPRSRRILESLQNSPEMASLVSEPIMKGENIMTSHILWKVNEDGSCVEAHRKVPLKDLTPTSYSLIKKLLVKKENEELSKASELKQSKSAGCKSDDFKDDTPKDDDESENRSGGKNQKSTHSKPYNSKRKTGSKTETTPDPKKQKTDTSSAGQNRLLNFLKRIVTFGRYGNQIADDASDASSVATCENQPEELDVFLPEEEAGHEVKPEPMTPPRVGVFSKPSPTISVV